MQSLQKFDLTHATAGVARRYARAMLKKSTGPQFPSTLISATARDRDRAPTCVVVAFLHLASRGIYHVPPDGQNFVMGSDPARCRVVIKNAPWVSGQHALVHLADDRVYLVDMGSTNGTRIHGRPERNGSVKPGQVFSLGGAEFVALSQPMLDQLLDLTLYVGQRERLPKLLTLDQSQHVVLLGGHHAPLEEVARAAHRAVASPASPIVCVDPLRNSHTERKALADAINGRIFIDGRGSPRRPIGPTFSAQQLEQLQDPRQLTALTVGVVRPKDIDLRLIEQKAFVFRVPSISDRIRDGELDELIDSIYVKWCVPYTASLWAADLKQRLVDHTWRRDHEQFTAVVVAVGRMWAGLDEHNAVKGLGVPRTIKYWLEDLDLTYQSVRAFRPR